MKCIIINGSPRKRNTWSVVEEVKNNILGEYEEIHLLQENIGICKGCFLCIMEGEDKCPHFNKINPIIEKIREADKIIISSPVYAMNVTGLLKNFFDHTAYLYHRPEFFTKIGLVVVTTAGAGDKKVSKYIDETLRHWGVNKVYKISFKCGGKDSFDKDKVKKVCKKFKLEKLSQPGFKDILYYNVWRAMAKTDGIKADTEDWNSTGLIKYEFSPSIKLNIIKKIFGKIIYSIFLKVF